MNTRDSSSSIILPWCSRTEWCAECKHCHIRKTVRALIIVSSVPPHFWPDTVSTATYLIIIQPSCAFHGGIPYEHLWGKTPDYSSLRLFGCLCYVLAPHERTTLSVFMGYSAEQKGYRCWDPVARRMRISHNVTSDEYRPFYPRPSDVSATAVVKPLSFLTSLIPLSPLCFFLLPPPPPTIPLLCLLPSHLYRLLLGPFMVPIRL